MSSALADCVVPARDVDVDQLDEDGLHRLLATVRKNQQALDLLVTRIGMRANDLAADGASAPAREMLLGQGAVRGHVARTEAARSEIAKRIPAVGNAIHSGSLGSDGLDSLARHTGRLSDEQVELLDVAGLVERAAALPADTFDRSVKRAVDEILADGGLATAEEKRAKSEFRHWFDHRTGMGKFSGQLDPERYEALSSAIDQHVTAMANSSDGGCAKNAKLAAAAVVELITGSTGHNTRLPHISVVVDEYTLLVGDHAEAIRQTANGHELSTKSVARLCCDAVMQRVVLDDRGVPIDVGRKHRTATDAQWTALRSIYSGCGWVGCDRPLSHCQAHHILEWEHGGGTDIGNLIPLCTEHHHRVHEGQWHVELLPDRALAISKPDGSLHTVGDPPSRKPQRTENRGAGSLPIEQSMQQVVGADGQGAGQVERDRIGDELIELEVDPDRSELYQTFCLDAAGNGA